MRPLSPSATWPTARPTRTPTRRPSTPARRSSTATVPMAPLRVSAPTTARSSWPRRPTRWSTRARTPWRCRRCRSSTAWIWPTTCSPTTSGRPRLRRSRAATWARSSPPTAPSPATCGRTTPTRTASTTASRAARRPTPTPMTRWAIRSRSMSRRWAAPPRRCTCASGTTILITPIPTAATGSRP